MNTPFLDYRTFTILRFFYSGRTLDGKAVEPTEEDFAAVEEWKTCKPEDFTFGSSSMGIEIFYTAPAKSLQDQVPGEADLMRVIGLLDGQGEVTPRFLEIVEHHIGEFLGRLDHLTQEYCDSTEPFFKVLPYKCASLVTCHKAFEGLRKEVRDKILAALTSRAQSHDTPALDRG